MPAVEQTARTFRTKVAWNERIGSVDHTIIDQTRKRITCAKTKPGSEVPPQLERHPAIKTVAGRDELFELSARRIGTQIVDCGERDFDHRRRTWTVQIHHGDRNAKLNHSRHRI